MHTTAFAIAAWNITDSGCLKTCSDLLSTAS